MAITAISDLLNIKLTTFAYYAFTTFVAISIASGILKMLKNIGKTAQYKKAAKKKRTERDQQLKQINLPPLNISESLRDKILNSDATTLLEMLKTSQVTSEQILIAYFERVRTIGLEYELITEIAFKEALDQARKCDQLRKENPSACKGVLFGLPISLKDMFILKDKDASCGACAMLFKPAKDDGYLVKILKGEGAIPFVKSNIPQALLTIDSYNNIWGSAKNPWNKERGVGGSSGGEAALIAARCSPLGMGNDIGGSLRIPPLFCGVVGFKPTSGRITHAGTIEVAPTLDYLPTLRVATGPIAKSVKDVSLMMKTLLSDQSHRNISITEQDPHYMRIGWNEEEVFKKHKTLRIGYFKSLEYFPPSPANQRAVEEAVKALKKKGYDMVEIELPHAQELMEIYFLALFGDGEARLLSDCLQGEAPIDDFVALKAAAATPSFVRKLLSPLLSALGEKRLLTVLDNFKNHSAYDYLKLTGRRNKAQQEFFKFWEEKKLDGMISPGLAFPGTKRGLVKDIVQGVCYAYILNVLDIPTGVVPVTVVKEGEDSYPKELTKHHDMIHRKIQENMKGTVGLPVGVQVSTMPWQEEKCVNIMLQLEEELQFRAKHPFPI